MTLPNPMPLLEANPIVPVVVIEDVKDAVPTAQALLEGGISCAEVTFRTAAAPAALEAMAQVEGMTVGAGTVLNGEQARQAVDCGAQFIVSPGFHPSIVEDLTVPFLPGIANATDIMAVLEYGVETVKFFPAVPMGGLPVLNALAAPFPQLKFLPTGGIGPKNLAEWISHPKIVSVGGSWMVTKQMIAAGEFDAITELSRQALQMVQEAGK
ncbi:MAG: bifunctional 4-hydroxy-2-oxoglutarate aldolase/2-dehydro-3-deoxy-phosphogluconate aldolase [Actinomycetaceae bacterium]|nr:bifunctional 4-hydroxy-2-oxoglutarate aldolase/2-dehydro-3-deoxy-phosphogluconate aldolase [Actinomycetaceae bacterium]